MELVPCGGCRRHVDARETACPFCAAAITARPQRAMPRGRITRAAVFSAALVACESKQPAPQPAPVPQQQGSDDLEKMLDGDHHVADRPPPPAASDASLADATAVATSAVDAGITVDAGMSREKMIELKTERDKRRREQLERKRKELIEQELAPPPPPPDDRFHNIPKPYGAPPARRRLV
jgi:hypothetical protein